MTPFNLPAAILALLFAGGILLLVRRERLGALQTFWWLVATTLMLVLGFVPWAATVVGRAFGLGNPATAVLGVGLCLVFAKLLFMDAERVRQEAKIRILAQKMAAYETEIRELKERKSGESGGEEA
jgi:hypothetical protein